MADVGKQRGSNGKLIGGITGKGFMPGQSGNPTGKAKGTVSLRATLKRLLKKDDAETIINVLMGYAKAGQIKHIQEIFEQVDGPQPKTIEIDVGEKTQRMWRVMRDKYAIPLKDVGLLEEGEDDNG